MEIYSIIKKPHNSSSAAQVYHKIIGDTIYRKMRELRGFTLIGMLECWNIGIMGFVL